MADEEVRTVQKLLIKLGYDPGEADGFMGPKTERAIRIFQQRRGLVPTGAVSPALVDALIEALAE